LAVYASGLPNLSVDAYNEKEEGKLFLISRVISK
jgi:hypothetical protein